MGILDFMHGQAFQENLNTGGRALERELAAQKSLGLQDSKLASLSIILELTDQRSRLQEENTEVTNKWDAETGLVALILDEIRNNVPQRRFSDPTNREFRDIARNELARLSNTDRALASQGGRFSSKALPLLRDRLQELVTELFEDPKRTQLHNWVTQNCKGNVTEEIRAYQQCVNTGLKERGEEEIDFMALYRLNTPESKSKEEWEAIVRVNVPDAEQVLAGYQAKYPDPEKYFEAIKALGEHATMMASKIAAEADEEAQEALGQLQDEAMGLFGRAAYRAMRIGVEAMGLDIQGQIGEYEKAIDEYKKGVEGPGMRG